MGDSHESEYVFYTTGEMGAANQFFTGINLFLQILEVVEFTRSNVSFYLAISTPIFINKLSFALLLLNS